MPRVRIPWQPEGAVAKETPVRLNIYEKGQLVRSPVVAFASGIYLRDAVSVVSEDFDGASPCRYLEGELTAWTGRFREQAEPSLRKILEPMRLANLFEAQAGIGSLLKSGVPLGMNTRRAQPAFAGSPQARAALMAYSLGHS